RKGEEYYQITLGGSADDNSALGQIVGPAFSSERVVDAIETVIETYLRIRSDGERFIDTFRRVGLQPFKEGVYAAA
ncbi:MAG: nitrite/sulfite reductase, partial [Geminicoccales bacterium]